MPDCEPDDNRSQSEAPSPLLRLGASALRQPGATPTFPVVVSPEPVIAQTSLGLAVLAAPRALHSGAQLLGETVVVVYGGVWLSEATT